MSREPSFICYRCGSTLHAELFDESNWQSMSDGSYVCPDCVQLDRADVGLPPVTFEDGLMVEPPAVHVNGNGAA